MLRVNMSKSEIEKQLDGKGGFTQMDYLNTFLKEPLTMEMKKFVYVKLSDLYEKMGMLEDAAKAQSNASMVSIPFVEKIKHFVKEAEFYIKAGKFEGADEAMKKAFSQSNSMQKQEIYDTIKASYKNQAKEYEETQKRAHASRVYEKLLDMKISDIERKEIKDKLLSLYEKLGKRKEYLELERMYLG